MENLLLIGLGNPGAEYEWTRHNIGFRVADAVSGSCRIPLKETCRHAVYGRGNWRGKELVIAKPTTYMNRSGLAGEQLIQILNYSPNQALVICDDANLPLGELRLRKRGSSGGQKGLQSLIDHWRTTNFPRLRVGIGSAPEGMALEDYVLDEFSPDEEEQIEGIIVKARNAVLGVLTAGFDRIMNQYNRRSGDRLENQDENQSA